MLDEPVSPRLSVPADEVARRWIDAVNQRDVHALLEVADPAITLHPTGVLGEDTAYRGHDGLRTWVARLAAAEPLSEQVWHVHRGRGERVVLLGSVSLAGRELSPFAIVLSVSEAKVTEARAFLSGEAELRAVGHIAA